MNGGSGSYLISIPYEEFQFEQLVDPTVGGLRDLCSALDHRTIARPAIIGAAAIAGVNSGVSSPYADADAGAGAGPGSGRSGKAVVRFLRAGTGAGSQCRIESSTEIGGFENRRGDYCRIKSVLNSKASKRPPPSGYDEIEYLIATVPDPKDSRLDHQFDRALDAIRRAIESADYTFDRYWLPWDRSRTAAPAILPADPKTAQDGDAPFARSGRDPFSRFEIEEIVAAVSGRRDADRRNP